MFYSSLKTIMIAIVVCLSAHASAGNIKTEQVHLELVKDRLDISYQFQRPAGMDITEVGYYLRTESKNDLPISFLADAAVVDSPMTATTGRVSFSIPAKYLASGNYQVILKAKVPTETGKTFLKSNGWNAMLTLNDYSGKDVEIRARILPIEGVPGLWFFARAQDGLGPNPNQFKFYFLSVGGKLNVGKSFQTQVWSTKRSYAAVENYVDDMWHSYVFRCVGNRIEAELDGRKMLEMLDPDDPYKEGTVGLRMGYASCYLGDFTVKDLQSDKIVFDLNSTTKPLSESWHTLKGEWALEKGYLAFDETVLGSFTVSEQANIPRPIVKLKPADDAMQLTINGTPFLPLLLSPGETEFDAFKPSTSVYLKNTFKAGIKLYAPILFLGYDESTKGPKLKAMDDLMSQMLLACPDAYFVVRTYLVPPPDMPEAEKTLVTRRPGDLSDTPSDVAGIGKFNASLASNHYREYATRALRELIAHMRAQPYSERFIGLLLAGAGYEGNWGQPNGNYGLWMDACAAQERRFSVFLKAKYGTEEALRIAWGDGKASLASPPLPGLEDRTVSDVAGFRDPVKTGRSRWISDFLDMYCEQNIEVAKPFFDTVQRDDPDTFYGRFGGPVGTCSKAWAGIQLYSSYRYDLLELTNPGVTFIAGCLGYADRMAGGTSVYTVQAWESIRRHGKLALGEADINTHMAAKGEKSCEDTIASMRREFAHTVLIGRQAMWYFDMAYSGPWYDDPPLIDEMGRQTRIGEAALKLEHRSVADVLVVQDNRSLRYFSSSPSPIAKGQGIGMPWALYAHHQVHVNVESMSRSGAQMDFILSDDFGAMPRYKLNIFPTQFYCDTGMRENIHKRLNDEGGVCFFFTAAGLLNEKGAGLANMEDLLGMNVKFDGPSTLNASSIPGEHPIARELGKGVELEDGKTQWYRFFVDDKEAIPLALYADGKVAMAIKKYGKGFVVYSGIPVISPAVYRAVARFAGSHIYSASDDSFFADNQFVSIHTKSGGAKRIQLPKNCHEVVELFTGNRIPCENGQIAVTLPEKHTDVYYMGDDSEFLAALKRIAAKDP